MAKQSDGGKGAKERNRESKTGGRKSEGKANRENKTAEKKTTDRKTTERKTDRAPKKDTDSGKSRKYEKLVDFTKNKGFDVTSTTGGTHNKGSAHYQGRAIDVRTNNKTDAEVDAFIKEAKAKGFKVLDERKKPAGQKVWTGPHLHLEIKK